jgi:urease subunit alpha
VTVLDAVLGVVKADVGVKDGVIVGVGKAGNSGTMDGVTPGLDVGPATDAVSGEQLILTAGGIDTHVHFIAPQQVYAALSNGVTTLFGGGIGPTDGSNGTTVTSGRWNIEMMLRSIEGLPVNIGILGKGSSAGEAALVEQILAGAAGFKIHEDWGAAPAAIRAALSVADSMDVQVSIHTDTLNEAGFSRTRSPPSTAARSTRSTARAPAAATLPTSSRSPARTTCCPAPPTRHCRSGSTRRASCST